jgi:hypothetical protein
MRLVDTSQHRDCDVPIGDVKELGAHLPTHTRINKTTQTR